MSLLRCLFLVILLLMPLRAPTASEDAAYLAGVADLPLMPGLRELADAGIVFDKPSGRIVEAYAAGIVSAADVLAFYRETLPELGWQAEDDHHFRREGERLELELLKGGEVLTVHFTLAPD